MFTRVLTDLTAPHPQGPASNPPVTPLAQRWVFSQTKMVTIVTISPAYRRPCQRDASSKIDANWRQMEPARLHSQPAATSSLPSAPPNILPQTPSETPILHYPNTPLPHHFTTPLLQHPSFRLVQGFSAYFRLVQGFRLSHTKYGFSKIHIGLHWEP